MKVTGTIPKVEWQNPHVWFYVDVKDESGKITTWGFSDSPPGSLMRRGITKDALKIGAVVNVEGSRARDGSNNASGRRVTFADGKNVFTARKAENEDALDVTGASGRGARAHRRRSRHRRQDIPRMSDGKPDFSGIYTAPSTVNATGPRGNLIFNADKMAPVKPGAESLLYQPRTGDARVDEPRAVCLPSGFPSGMLYILPIQIVQNPKYIVIIPELQRAARIIPLDGRPHREGIEPSYYGDSVGKWEGDTLVIDTVNFKRWILDDYHYTDPTKSRWHSDALRTTEHLRREGNKLHYRITIDDPKIFTRPFSQDFELTLRPDWEQIGLLEYVCEENNRCAGGNCRESDAQ